MNPKNEVKYSKFLSLVLRHKPEEAGLTLDKNGWAPIGDVVKALKSRYGDFNRADLETIVENNSKKRFIIEGEKIRANQGHSVDIDLALESMTPPPILYHGTKQSFMSSIMKQGLVPGKRQHVHLSETKDTAEVVAARRSGTSAILEIDTTLVTSPFFRSENGVWLTEIVPSAAIFSIEFLGGDVKK